MTYLYALNTKKPIANNKSPVPLLKIVVRATFDKLSTPFSGIESCVETNDGVG